MSQPKTINISEGQTLLLYKEDKIILKKKHDASATITTTWDSFVGSDSEVDEKIASLSLLEIKKPTELKNPVAEVALTKAEKPSIGRKILNFIKNIFSK